MSPFEVPWSAAVTVCMPDGTQRRITGIQDALELLENEWPTMHGERRNRAIAACKGCLKSERPLAVAREEFIAACVEQRFILELEAPGSAWDGNHPTA